MGMIVAIASGGAIGAVLRHLFSAMSLKLFGTGFPYGTLGVNVFGSFVMGVLVAYLAHHWNPPQEVKAFLIVGLLGALTTFSTFSLETIMLWERGEIIGSLLYVLASVVLSIMALAAGLLLIRQIYV